MMEASNSLALQKVAYMNDNDNDNDERKHRALTLQESFLDSGVAAQIWLLVILLLVEP